MVTQYLKQCGQALFEIGKKMFLQKEDESNINNSESPILTSNQERLCKELDDAVCGINNTIGKPFCDRNGNTINFNYGCVRYLEEFLNNNKDDKDLKFVLNLKGGETKSTVLHNLVDWNIEAVGMLLNAGADPNIRNGKGRSAIECAIDTACKGWDDVSCYVSVIELLVTAKADPNAKSQGKAVLELVTASIDYFNKAECIRVAKLLVASGADINSSDRCGQTLLHRVSNGQEGIAELLLASVKDDKRKRDKLINARDENGNTPLHCAVEHVGFSNVVELLIEHQADYTIKNNRGDTPLHVAGHKKGDSNMKPLLGQNLCFGADTAFIKEGLITDIVKHFLRKNLDINVKDVDNATPLLIASRFGSADIVRLYLDHGADIHSKDKYGNSALHCAASNKYTDNDAEHDKSLQVDRKDCTVNYKEIKDNREIIKILMGKGINAHKDKKIDVNVKNRYGHTPLFSAVEHRKYANTQLLLGNGADVDAIDENGFKAIHFAIKQGSLELLKILLPKILERDEHGNPNTYDDGNKIEEIDTEKTKELLSIIDKKGNTLIHHAVRWGCDEEMLNFLVEHGVDINKKNDHDISPIHITAKYGKFSQMKFFVDNKADLNIRCGKFSKSVIDSTGKEKELSGNTLDHCISVRDGNVDASSTVDITDNTEHKEAPAISIVVDNDNCNTTAMLLGVGAKPSVEDSIGWLPLHIAIKRVCDHGCKEEERQEKYEMIRTLASVSDVECLMSGIDKKSKTYKDQFFEKIKDSLIDALEIINEKMKNSLVDRSEIVDDRKIRRKVIEAFRSIMSEVTDSKKEINKILKGAIENKNGERLPNAPISEKAGTSSLDDDFYNSIGSHVTRPVLYPDLSEELADNFGHWNGDYNWFMLENILEEEGRPKLLGCGDINDNYVNIDNGTSAWSNASQKSIENNIGKQENELPPTQTNNVEKRFNKKPKEASFKLALSQQRELEEFLVRVSKVKDVGELNDVVDEALKLGVRINSAQYNSNTFTNAVISKMGQLNKVNANYKITSDIICKLASRGAILNDDNKIDFVKFVKELEVKFKYHKTNIKRAYLKHKSRIKEFREIIESAISNGKLEKLEIDNTAFSLEYSEDSIIDVAKVTDGAKSLWLNQGDIELGGNIVKVGESEVEIKVGSGVRDYTNLSDNGDITLTFYTSLGELEVRLYSDIQYKGIVRVDVYDQDKFNKLIDIEEEIGKNCLLGGDSVCEAIEQGYFERSGKLLRASETISLSEKDTKEMKEAARNLQCSEIVHSLLDDVCLPKVSAHKNKARIVAPGG
ncbi:MAG: ankyrin repeat domain-containing protein [Wolbachia sp.]|nr:ankyrin repeat domain-containing protein [Wolbachia sp.]MDD9336215.1 ankyrin repeat domain-containing protein [Wolbachia sp.]